MSLGEARQDSKGTIYVRFVSLGTWLKLAEPSPRLRHRCLVCVIFYYCCHAGCISAVRQVQGIYAHNRRPREGAC